MPKSKRTLAQPHAAVQGDVGALRYDRHRRCPTCGSGWWKKRRLKGGKIGTYCGGWCGRRVR